MRSLHAPASRARRTAWCVLGMARHFPQSAHDFVGRGTLPGLDPLGSLVARGDPRSCERKAGAGTCRAIGAWWSFRYDRMPPQTEVTRACDFSDNLGNPFVGERRTFAIRN